MLRTPEGVERAFKKLDTVKADLVFWKSGAQPPQMLAAPHVANSRLSASLDCFGGAIRNNIGRLPTLNRTRLPEPAN